MKKVFMLGMAILCTMNISMQAGWQETALNFIRTHKQEIAYGGLGLGTFAGICLIPKEPTYRYQAEALLYGDGRNEKISHLEQEVKRLNRLEYDKPYWEKSAYHRTSPYIRYYIERISLPTSYHITLGQRNRYYLSLDAFCKGEMDTETYAEYYRFRELEQKAYYSDAKKVGAWCISAGLAAYGLKKYVFNDSGEVPAY